MSTVKDTSKKAYREIIDEGLVGERQAEVLKYIADNNDMTDSEIAYGLKYKDMNKTRPRRKDLVDFGIVESNGKKECGVTGRTCYQWRLVKKLPSKKKIQDLKVKKKKVKCPMCHGTGKVIQQPIPKRKKEQPLQRTIPDFPKGPSSRNFIKIDEGPQLEPQMIKMINLKDLIRMKYDLTYNILKQNGFRNEEIRWINDNFESIVKREKQ